MIENRTMLEQYEMKVNRKNILYECDLWNKRKILSINVVKTKNINEYFLDIFRDRLNQISFHQIQWCVCMALSKVFYFFVV